MATLRAKTRQRVAHRAESSSSERLIVSKTGLIRRRKRELTKNIGEISLPREMTDTLGAEYDERAYGPKV